MGKIEKKSSEYIQELEEKIVELSLGLKSKRNELNSIQETNRKVIGKLVHNIKNPVGVIFSFSEMILENIEDYSTEKLEKHVQIIKNSAAFSVQFLNTIAKYSQLQSPELTFNIKAINYNDLLNKCINELNLLAIEKNCTIEKRLPEHEIFIDVDEEEYFLALRNIIHNALRYSPENSTITIEVKENSNSVETMISDEGMGISDENLPQIFNEFFVVNTYSEDQQKCIGLGLTIANKIILGHQGKILATSTINKGSNFKIMLPKA